MLNWLEKDLISLYKVSVNSLPAGYKTCIKKEIYLTQERKIQSQQSRGQTEKDSFRCELISFNEVLRLSRILAQKVKASGYMPDLIVAIGRGGYVPGRLVSDFLLFNDLTSMKIEHYSRAADMREEARIKFPIPVDITGKKILILDDVTDTGETLNLAVDYVLNLNPASVRTAVLQHKISSNFTPDFYAQKVLKWRWIIYPWARYEDLAGFAEKIIQNRTLDLSQIIAEFKHRYELDLKETELLKILSDLTERGELESTKQDNRKLWSIKK
ncbi:phosphoribosyltransferase [Methanosarcina barkeri]|uniref:Xanthine-guanine phosphoribosyltransferase n=1 Tax=Methanosarcina barkeri 227 TaxID=1434106 RepID=A0A0E3QZG7_METBA|nr:phosphoribosyltransferase [Methanosarcina barkeri]AKB57334.1 Xanthine-guanine phosphoribosyltransferase [Methanosarcina barkeri 227]